MRRRDDIDAAIRDNSRPHRQFARLELMMPRRLPVAAALAFAACAAAHADFHAEYATVRADESVPNLARIELSGDRARMDFGRASVLFAGDKMTALLHGRKRFVDLQKTQASEQKKSEDAAKVSNAQLAAAEQRPSTHAAAGASPTGTLTAAATGKNDKVNGIACETYRIEFDGHHIQDICLASFADAGIPAQDSAALQHAFERLNALNERRSSGTYRAALAFVPDGKFPVRITKYLLAGDAFQTVELKQVASGGGRPNDYAIPAGYREVATGAPAAPVSH
jgi:hypothetical protein